MDLNLKAHSPVTTTTNKPRSQLLLSCSFLILIKMAESFAFDVAHSLLGKLASCVYKEASRAYGVYDDLKGMEDTLSIVKGVLLDAEEKKDQKHGLREWLRQIQNVCYDAEDVLDEVEFHHKRKQVVNASGSSSKMKVGNFFSSHSPFAFRRRVAREIKKIKDRLDKVANDGNKFGLSTVDVEPRPLMQRREMTHSHVDASNVIGREYDTEEIIKLLTQPPHPDGDQSPCVVPIVGIGGLGKTALAKLVFNDKRMDGLFQLKMWVCVSDDFDVRQLIIKIINSASASTPDISLAHQQNINHLDIGQLVSLLKHKLSGQKFLLVLDDIWNNDRAKWIELKDLIKVGAIGSKIIMTTRSESIAFMMGTVPPYDLKGLSAEDSLSLFVKWAFKEGEELKYPNLVETGKEIVKKCKGVPLAVRTVASSLFSKFDLSKWEFVRDHEIWNLEQNKDDILPALKLSYDQMPSNLRHCFAFFSLYPKDRLISSKEITSLWTALGLVQSLDGTQKPEDIAREYIDDLKSRSFLQDFEDFGIVIFFKVHDLIHDLALYVAKEECVVVGSQTRNLSEHARHLSIVENDSLGHAFFPKRVRTILFPIEGVGLDNKSLLDTWVSRYKYLRVLDLSNSSLETLPNSIAKLEHLRVLYLSFNCKIKRLHHSICKLQNLQVLSLEGCLELETLPKKLGKLISLRQLRITTKQSILLENEIASLGNLQALGFFSCDKLKFLFSGAQLASLEVLVIKSCESLESLPLYILPQLRALAIANCKMLNLSMNNESPIQKLRMTYLYLADLPGLQTLPQWIVGAANTLETLGLENLPNLKTLPEWLTTMTHLKRLSIFGCPQLLSLPSDMHCLTSLERLAIYDCPELCRKCRPQSGVYWPMISHIKIIDIY